MRIGDFHLTYCSNIHAGETWAEVDHNLRTHLPRVRSKLGVTGPFGIGLRLSAAAAVSLCVPETLARFQRFLDDNNFYVFTINGFPYGTFHRQRVKEEVYLPDWRDPLRLDYTNRLATILATILPVGMDGSVSTVPGAFEANVRTQADVRLMAENILRHAAFLRDLHAQTGKKVTLAIEPEPCCHIETIAELVRFFTDELLTHDDVREYVGVCFDACHMAVEYENPADAFKRLTDAGIRIFKIQISSALRLRFSDKARALAALAPFAESTYLHQVVQSDGRTVERYPDLPDAFTAAGDSADEKEWRVHFHVPIFMEEANDGLSTTQNYLAEVLSLVRAQRLCHHLEAETYTWDVLPESCRNVDIETAIARELAWVVKRLGE